MLKYIVKTCLLSAFMIFTSIATAQIPYVTDDYFDNAHKPTPPQHLSLQEAIMLALRYNPQVQSSKLDRVTEKFNLRVAQNEFELQYALAGSLSSGQTRTSGNSSSNSSSSLTPSTSLKGQYGTQYQLSANNPYDIKQGHYNPGLDLSITQPLIRGFGRAVTLADLYDAQDREKSNQYNFTSQIISTVVQVTNDYRALVQSQNEVLINKSSLENLKQSLANDTALIEAGGKAAADLLQSQSSYASAKVSYENSLNSLTQSKLALMNDLGLSANINFSVSNDMTIKKVVPNFTDCYHTALTNNPNYLSTLLTLNSAKRALLQAKDNARAKLDFVLSANTGNGDGGPPNDDLRSLTNNKNTQLQGELRFEIPIDDYSVKQQILDAKIALQKTRIDIDRAKRELRTEIYNDINSVNSNYKAYILAEQALVFQEKNQTKLLTQQKLGLVSTFEVTQNQQSLDEAKQSLISSKISYLNSLTNLYERMGVTLEKWDITLRY